MNMTSIRHLSPPEATLNKYSWWRFRVHMKSYPAHRSVCEKTILCYIALILVLICFVCVVLVLCLSVCVFYVLEARPPGIWTLISPVMANDPVFDPA